MKLAIATAALFFGSATAFAPTSSKTTASSSLSAATLPGPGAIEPTGFFDPLGLAEKTDFETIRLYREAEVTHGRVAMLAAVGFLVGEKVEGTSFLFDASIKGPAISHLAQVPESFFTYLVLCIGFAEARRAQIGWVEPENVPENRFALLREGYFPGDIGFDPLGLRPADPIEFEKMATKELQNGRLAMLGVAGFMAQELVDGKGIIEHLTSM